MELHPPRSQTRFYLLASEEQPEGFEAKTRRNVTEEQLGDLVHLSTSVVYEVLRRGVEAQTFRCTLNKLR